MEKIDQPETRSSVLLTPVSRPFYVRVAHAIEDFIDEINWIHVAFKICAFSYISFMAWITWHVLPINGHWDIGRQPDKIPATFQNLDTYFGTFDGFWTCNIRALDLYNPPDRNVFGNYLNNVFCPNRETLLQATSNGGRVGFDSPYTPKGCNYRWYSLEEICTILERFDSILFVGDEALQSIYSGLNILLRKDLVNGALQTWNMDTTEKDNCRCDNQFTKADCARHFITDSDEVLMNTNIGRSESDKGNRYVCQRTPLTFINIRGGTPGQDAINKFNTMAHRAPRTNYAPIPIIHSLSATTTSRQDAAKSLIEFTKLADASGRKTPMLWIGPTAAGHIEIKGRKSNQEIWDFDAALEKTARANDVEVLKMWNMTVQATSWDGMRFGENVALVQAMLVVNWLGRLESS